MSLSRTYAYHTQKLSVRHYKTNPNNDTANFAGSVEDQFAKTSRKWHFNLAPMVNDDQIARAVRYASAPVDFLSLGHSGVD